MSQSNSNRRQQRDAKALAAETGLTYEQALTALREGRTPQLFTDADVPNLRIHFDDDGFSVGRFYVGPSQKEAIDLIRNGLLLGHRAFTLLGPTGAGKSALAEQIAAILGYPLVTLPAARNGRPTQLGAGRSAETVTVSLSAEQVRQLRRALPNGTVLTIGSTDAELQSVLAKAVKLGELSIDGKSLRIDPDTTIFFEVTCQEGTHGALVTDLPCLSFDAVSDTLPIEMDKLDRTAMERAFESHPPIDEIVRTLAERDAWRAKQGDTLPDYRSDTLAKLAGIDSYQTRRAALVGVMADALAPSAPQMSSDQGREWLAAWVESLAFQAYQGDNRADRTLKLMLAPFFPSDTPGAARNRMLQQGLVDANDALARFCDLAYKAGAKAREQA